jgi:hypothetical protein
MLAVGLIALVALSSLAWVVARGLGARDELLGSLPLAAEIRASVASGDSDISGQLDELQQRTASARAATSDPIWRAYENIPVVGINLTAFREAAEVIDDIAVDALPLVGELADSITLSSLTPSDGGIDLQPILDARPALSAVAEALTVANERAQTINTEGTISQIGAAVDELVALIDETTTIVSGLDTAAELLPPMLGVEQPRTYLLLFLNNAELRSGGGIPGALSTVVARGGQLELTQQSTASDLGVFTPPPLAATEEEKAIFAIPVDAYMQNVTATPEFSRSAEFAQAMWAERTGEQLDGVIGIDVGALELILAAVGPIELTPDDTITADNAAELLLSEVYARFENPADQDAFFALAASRIFETVTNLSGDPGRLVEALAMAAGQQRIALWSANPVEQQRLLELELAGGLPVSSAENAVFGLYVNDSTGAKMSYYLDYSIAIAQAICREDQRPTTATTIRLRSTAPVDAATSLPRYVTGGGGFGVPPGVIRNNVHLYLPAGENVFDVRVAGESVAFSLLGHSGLVVVSQSLDLTPGELIEYTVYSNGAESVDRDVTVQHTPSIREVPVATDLPLDCADVRSVRG